MDQLVLPADQEEGLGAHIPALPLVEPEAPQQSGGLDRPEQEPGQEVVNSLTGQHGPGGDCQPVQGVAQPVLASGPIGQQQAAQGDEAHQEDDAQGPAAGSQTGLQAVGGGVRHEGREEPQFHPGHGGQEK